MLADLLQAYYDARRHKRCKPYQQRFEAQHEANLKQLCNDLWNRTYTPAPSACFIITDPKQREVFAAAFRDRIVHHLYYNYTHELYERTFIHDSYSCIQHRGTHFGIKRLEKHIRAASNNYTQRCFVLKMDVRGYFMHINRERLLAICLRTLDHMATHRVLKHSTTTWEQMIDMDFVRYLTREIVLLNPTQNCHRVGRASDWNGLPDDKSLFHSPMGCGLPIGNLTSQLFSNVYLNELDQYMKRTLHCEHYGRYVDDFYVVSPDKEWLHRVAQATKTWLRDNLDLTLHEGKIVIASVTQGIDFLGARLRPYHIEVSTHAKKRMASKLDALHKTIAKQLEQQLSVDIDKLRASLNSFLGIMSHGKNYHTRIRMMERYPLFKRFGYFDKEYLHFIPYGDIIHNN